MASGFSVFIGSFTVSFPPPSLAREQRAEAFYVQGVLVFRVFRKIFNVVSDGLPVGFFHADIGGVDQSRGNVRLPNRMIMSMSFHISLSAFAEDHGLCPWMSALLRRARSRQKILIFGGNAKEFLLRRDVRRRAKPLVNRRRITPTSVTKLSFHLATSYSEKANEKRISSHLIPRNFSLRNFRDFTPEIAVRFLGASRGNPGTTGFARGAPLIKTPREVVRAVQILVLRGYPLEVKIISDIHTAIRLSEDIEEIQKKFRIEHASSPVAYSWQGVIPLEIREILQKGIVRFAPAASGEITQIEVRLVSVGDPYLHTILTKKRFHELFRDPLTGKRFDREFRPRNIARLVKWLSLTQGEPRHYYRPIPPKNLWGVYDQELGLQYFRKHLLEDLQKDKARHMYQVTAKNQGGAAEKWTLSVENAGGEIVLKAPIPRDIPRQRSEERRV